MSDFYGMDGQPIDLEEFKRLHKNHDELKVAVDVENGYRISTFLVCLNHGKSDGPPLIFETTVFDRNGREIYCQRFSTKEEAIAGHAKAVEWVKSGAVHGA